MLRSRRTIWFAVAAAALLFGGFGLASCGGGYDNKGGGSTETVTTATGATETRSTTGTEKPTVVTIDVVNGQPQGGIVRKTVNEGDRVVIVVNSDVSDEIHVHGYDIKREVAAGGTARIAFEATLPGRFEIELEGRGTQIADLTVEP